MALLPLVFSSNYLIGVLTVSVLYGIWAITWDFMSGLTGRENFGHALFIGVGAYTAGFMNTTFGFNGWWSLPASMVMAVALRAADRPADAAPQGPVLRAGDALGLGDHAAADADLLGEAPAARRA